MPDSPGPPGFTMTEAAACLAKVGNRATAIAIVGPLGSA